VIYSRVHAQNAAAPARNRQTTGALPVVGAARRSPTVERAQFEHAIAILVGKAPADVTIGPGTADTTPPVIA